MLFWFIILYSLVSIAISLWGAKHVRKTEDFIIAGKKLPFILVFGTVFATWFGAETILGIPASFMSDGLVGIITDPLGASLCLILAGLVFAVPFWHNKAFTITSLYRQRYQSRTVETIITCAIIVSYLGWSGAQINAFGMILNVVSDDYITTSTGKWLGIGFVLINTVFGGMWSIAVTSVLQTIVIILGLILVSYQISFENGGIDHVVNHMINFGELTALPEFSIINIFTFFGMIITVMLGSIPQQDIYQRVQTAKTPRVAVLSTLSGACVYFCIALLPIYIVYSASLIAPSLTDSFLSNDAADTQRLLPTFILYYTPLFIQVLFFGALLSAIKSTASAILLAPSVCLAENIIRPCFNEKVSDRTMLTIMRLSTIFFALVVGVYTQFSDETIYGMVEDTYQITLVSAFVPLVMGLFWRRATTKGALWSIFVGSGTWVLALIYPVAIPAHILGLILAFISFILGSLSDKAPPPTIARAKKDAKEVLSPN